MKRPYFTGLILAAPFLLSGLSFSQSARNARNHGPDARSKFAGAWRLEWLEQPGADGKLQKIECCGMFIFTRNGRLAVQVMYPAPGTQSMTGPSPYAQGGYEASYGTYTVDERAKTFTYHVEGALVRSLIGKTLSRSYEFSGNQLFIKSTRKDERWKVAWVRDPSMGNAGEKLK